MTNERVFELYMDVLFRVRGKNLDARNIDCVSRVNPFLREFREKLKDIKIDKPGIQAHVESVDDFLFDLVDTTTLLCSQKLKWLFVERRDPINHEANKDHNANLLIVEVLRDISLEHGKYSTKLIAEIMDFHFTGNVKRGRWPRDRIMN